MDITQVSSSNPPVSKKNWGKKSSFAVKVGVISILAVATIAILATQGGGIGLIAMAAGITSILIVRYALVRWRKNKALPPAAKQPLTLTYYVNGLMLPDPLKPQILETSLPHSIPTCGSDYESDEEESDEEEEDTRTHPTSNLVTNFEYNFRPDSGLDQDAEGNENAPLLVNLSPLYLGLNNAFRD